MDRKPEEVLKKLRTLEKKHVISVITLAEPIASSEPNGPGATQRTSDASAASLDAATPASLEADLTHYKELFSKLRFSYVEQVTKEKFIRAIVGDPPLIVTPQENVELEKENMEAKAILKALKVEVADIVTELERRGRDLTQRYEQVKLEATKLEELPEKIAGLEESIARLRKNQVGGDAGPNMALPLSRTLDLVDERRKEREELERQLEQVGSQVARKQKEKERLLAELGPLETKRANRTVAAQEAKRRKEALGGVQDDLEEQGRWWRASETALKQMLDLPN